MAKGVLYIGGLLLFAAVFGTVAAFLHAIMGGIVHGLFMDPKGTVAGLMDPGIPVVAGFAAAEETVRRTVGPLLDRMERKQAQQ